MMTNVKKGISAILAVVMLLMLFPALSNDTEEPSETTTEDETQKLNTSYSLVIDAIDAEDYEAAKAYLDECFALCDPETNGPLYADLLLKQACIAVMEEQNDMALQALDATLELQPDLADAYLVRAQIYVSQGEIDEAVRNLEKYIELTEDASLYETVARLYESKGDFAAAQTAYEKYIVGTGGDLEQASIQAGIYKMQSGQLGDAVAVFENDLDSEKYGAEAAYYIGICKMSLEDYVGAKEAFDRCLEKGGNYEGIYYNRGVCSLVSEDWETAEEDFVKSIESEPYADDARYNLGVCQMRLEDYESAAATFTELIGDPDQADTREDGTEEYGTYYCRAMCHAMLGNLEEAIQDYTTCIDHEYESEQCYRQRAQVYAALGDYENYNNDLQNAQKLEE